MKSITNEVDHTLGDETFNLHLSTLIKARVFAATLSLPYPHHLQTSY